MKDFLLKVITEESFTDDFGNSEKKFKEHLLKKVIFDSLFFSFLKVMKSNIDLVCPCAFNIRSSYFKWCFLGTIIDSISLLPLLSYFDTSKVKFITQGHSRARAMLMLGKIVHTCNPGTWEVETGESVVQ